MKKTLIVLLLSMVVFALVSCGEKTAPVPEEKTDVTSAVTVTDETVSSSVSVTEAATSSVTSSVSQTSSDSVSVSETFSQSVLKNELPVSSYTSAVISEQKTESKITVTEQMPVTSKEKTETAVPETTVFTEAATTENEIIINEDGSIELPEVFF